MMFASTGPEHFEGTIDYGTCRINGDECYGCVYCPPERIVPYVQHNEPNPILVEFRLIEAEFWQGLDRRDTAGAWVDLIDEDPTISKPVNWGGLTDAAVITEQVSHARRVLTRLANLELRS